MAKLDAAPGKSIPYVCQSKQKFALESAARVFLLKTMFSGLFKRRKGSRASRAPDWTAAITLRPATDDDARALERLAGLYDRPLVSGPALLAFVDGELQAALSLAGDRELMDPYVPSAGLVDLLVSRLQQLGAQTDIPPMPRPRQQPTASSRTSDFGSRSSSDRLWGAPDLSWYRGTPGA